MYILLLDGTTCAPAYVHRGKFLQQRAPTANPLFTLKEAGFLCSACGLLRFYGETELAEVVDLILQTPLPDEDVVTQLLHEFHLEDPTSFAGSCTGTRGGIIMNANKLHIKQQEFYQRYGDADTVALPHVPPVLLTAI